MNERITLITGANRGIGLATAHGLAAAGHHVVLMCRSRKAGEHAAAQINTAAGRTTASLLVGDLASSRSIRRAASEFRDRHDRLDVLVNNAAIAPHRRRTSEDGIELQFAVNHLAPFLLTYLLTDLLIATSPSRIVNVASNAHFRGNMDFDNLQGERRYGPFSAYSRSKLANVMFTRELARRLEGTGVTANALHPGVIATGLLGWFLFIPRPLVGILRFRAKDTKTGAETSIYLATSPDVAEISGRYFDNRTERRPSRAAQDDALAARLWEVSELLLGIEFAPEPHAP